MSPTVDVDALIDRLAPRTPPPAPTWAGVHHRAAEHLVTAPGTGAATTHGTFDIGTGWVAELAGEWTTAAMPIVAATSITEVDPGRGVPALATVATVPTAGAQAGEKKALASHAFHVSPATGTVIDSTLYLNYSMQLDRSLTTEVARAMMQSAVAAEADRQVGAAIVAGAGAAADLDAALAVFDGRFLPSVLLLPPSLLGDYLPYELAAAGIRTVLAHVTKAVLLTPGAVTGWLLPLEATSVEASVLGRGTAYALYGAVAVDPTGAAVIG